MSWFCCFSLTVCEFYVFSRFLWCLLSSVQFSLLSSYFTSTPVLDLFNRLFPEFFLRLFSLHTFSASPSCFQCFSVHSPHLCSPASLHLHLSCFVFQSSRYRVIRCVPMILLFWFPDVPPCLSVPCITVILIMLHLLLFLPAVSCFWLHLLCSGVIIMTGAPFKLSSPYMCGIHYFKGTNKNLEICDLST